LVSKSNSKSFHESEMALFGLHGLVRHKSA
jgi:hypothetical protein